jgi:hypothetical protein
MFSIIIKMKNNNKYVNITTQSFEGRKTVSFQKVKSKTNLVTGREGL